MIGHGSFITNRNRSCNNSNFDAVKEIVLMRELVLIEISFGHQRFDATSLTLIGSPKDASDRSGGTKTLNCTLVGAITLGFSRSMIDARLRATALCVIGLSPLTASSSIADTVARSFSVVLFMILPSISSASDSDLVTSAVSDPRS